MQSRVRADHPSVEPGCRLLSPRIALASPAGDGTPEDPAGVELLLEPDAHPAARPFKEALVADGLFQQSVTSSLSRLYKPPHLDPDALEDSLRALPQAVGRAVAADIVRLNVSTRTAEGIHEHRESVPLEEVRRYPPTEHNLQLIYWYPGAPSVSVSMGPLFDALELHVSAGSPAEVQAVFAMLEERLGLERADEAGGLQAAADELTSGVVVPLAGANTVIWG